MDNSTVDFLGIGAQKCGTTWIYSCLSEHPDIFIPKIKEVHFFDIFYDKGMDYYKSLFKVSANKVSGEITPRYLYHNNCPERIYKYNPNIKLFVVLRNPIERAVSQYKMNLNNGKINTQNIFEIFDKDLPKNNSIRKKGHYAEQLKRYSIFKNLKILFYDDIINNPSKFIKNLYSYLGVDADFVPSDLNKIIKPIEKYKINPQISAKEMDFLKSYYIKHIEDLEAYLGEQLSHWK